MKSINPRLRLVDHDVRAQRLERAAGKREVVFEAEFEDGFQPHAPVKVAVEVDFRKRGGHRRF